MFKAPEVCIIPVAGLSTRNLPATKVIHKGFLPLDGIPIIQYAVDNALSIGVKEFVFIYSDDESKELFKRYFATNEWLEDHLESKGKTDLLELLRSVSLPDGVKVSFARQEQALGNGHAILMAADIVGKRDFIVIWPDEVFINPMGDTILQQLAEVHKEKGGCVVNIGEYPDEEIIRYGAMVDVTTEGKFIKGKGLIEKPPVDDIPSNYGVIGPYLLDNKVMQFLPMVKKGGNGEINLVDAIDLAAKSDVSFGGIIGDGIRLDCGTKENLEKSNIQMTLMRSPEMVNFVKKLV